MNQTVVDKKDSRPATAGDMKLEVIIISVANVDRSMAFYGNLGWRLDADFAVGADFRVVQFTPPGSSASVHVGTGISSAAPGSGKGLYLVVSDIARTRDHLLSLGVQVSDLFHRAGPGKPAISGPDPERRSYFTYATFKDPDGNEWLLQEVTSRFPGRLDSGETSFTSAQDLAAAFRRAAQAHAEHEKRMGGQYDENWPDWYAEYLVAEHSGKPLPL